MANPTCTVASLVEAQPCFAYPITSDHKKLALKVYFLAAELAAIGGTNYLSVLGTTLNTASNIFQNLSNDQLAAADLTIAYNNANAAGAGLSTNQQTLAGNVKVLNAFTDRQLKQAELLLHCALGRGKVYPQ